MLWSAGRCSSAYFVPIYLLFHIPWLRRIRRRLGSTTSWACQRMSVMDAVKVFRAFAKRQGISIIRSEKTLRISQNCTRADGRLAGPER